MLTLVCVYAGLCLCMHNGLNLIQNISLVFAYQAIKYVHSHELGTFTPAQHLLA